MTCTIKWNVLTFSEWKQRFNQIRRSTLLQSYPYAQAQSALHNQKPRWGLIEINGQEAGLVQIMEAGLFKNIFHAIIIDRGPLWFNGFGTLEHMRGFAGALQREFPARFGRRRRFMPEMESGAALGTILTEAGFKPQAAKPYETIWIDLTKSEDIWLKNLKSGWRGALRKAQKCGITIEWDDSGAHFPWLMKNYLIDKEEKNYDGPSLPLLTSLARYFIPNKEMMIGRALIDGKPIAGILLLCHGGAATYQIGWSSQKGRETAAHHLLLWEALCVLQAKGLTDFDLGGVNEDTAKGVKKFKSGMGGELVHISGLYS